MATNYAAFIDHTLLKPDATKEQIKQLCEEAKKYGFASVCVNPYWVKYCKRFLEGANVKVCTVVGFPLGATTTETKVFETKQAIENGADEIDMVINIGLLKTRDYERVKEEIRQVVDAAAGRLVKVIIETCLLTEEEKVKACQLAVEAGAAFVKTSTGFSTAGATAEDVALMRKTVGEQIGVKASGGIRSFVDMKKMIEAGAERIGTSSGVKIINETL
ncbi:deoxyribose-phosphate aldolase [Ureibacillus sp. FSL K6-8385]|uniref:Deoxyribose-phosphate aldolase n=1 Tax=Ureibacillus terrenus TaxID=118246 RepID=A0A540V4X1_9BACL|nr:deoxyribose-phosphate aldolase [Ureibacillus terrenus]MED3661518.1 deoxyribose-phosphate aldolase [Ureibacillus terrenus]MED3763985.1 deoxyribose-phosphate aldolase [Ureibacillus terrenus]TQE91794.1 deoxyribose-phosphate aldolase [Ureibacillus terrenus]